MRNHTDQVAVDFIGQNGNVLDANTVKAIENGELKIIECNHFVNVDLSSGPVKLLQISSAAKDGENTFDKGATPARENIVWKGLHLGHWKGATSGASLGGVVYSSVVDADIDPAWLNATIVVTQEKRELLRMPVKRFYQGAASDRSLENEGLNFENWRLIKADTLVTIDIEYPDGVAITPGSGNSFFVAISFKGAQTAER